MPDPLLVARRMSRAARFLNIAAGAVVVLAVVGTLLQRFDIVSPAKDSSLDAHVEAAREDWGLLFGEIGWSLALAGIVVGIGVVMRVAASALLVDVTRAEIEASRR